MNSIILCEGETDQIVLSEYFCHMYGFEFLRGAKNKPFGNAECCYIRGEDQLAIVYAAGNDFSEYVQKVLKINRLNFYLKDIQESLMELQSEKVKAHKS